METLLWESSPHIIANLILLCFIGIPVAIIDTKNQLIPLYLSIPGIAIAIFVQLFFNVSPLLLAAEILIGFILFYFIRILTKKGLGLGDALISAFIAILLGLWGWLVTIFIAASGALIFSLVILKMNIHDRTKRIPFAPFLLGGALITMLLYLLLL